MPTLIDDRTELDHVAVELLPVACIDLAARFGGRHPVTHEEQAAEWPPSDRPWLARIACRHGYVGVHGGDRLYAFTDRARIGARLRALPFIERAQGDTETRVVFHVDHLEAVLAILRPYRRRQVSKAERQRLAAMGAVALARHRSVGNVQSAETAPGLTQIGLPAPEFEPGTPRAPEVAEVGARPARARKDMGRSVPRAEQGRGLENVRSSTPGGAGHQRQPRRHRHSAGESGGTCRA